MQRPDQRRPHSRDALAIDRELDVDERQQVCGAKISFFPEVYASIRDGDTQQLEMNLNDEFRVYIDETMCTMEVSRNSFYCLMGICMYMANQAGLLLVANETIGHFYSDRLRECTNVGQIKDLIYEMIRDYTAEIQRAKTESSPVYLMQRCRSYINNHIYDDITAMQLADACNMSLSTLERHLKKECNCTPRQLILEEKIKKACFLLADTDESCAQISALLHFCSQSYFISCFNQAMGETPSAYREENRRALG